MTTEIRIRATRSRVTELLTMPLRYLPNSPLIFALRHVEFAKSPRGKTHEIFDIVYLSISYNVETSSMLKKILSIGIRLASEDIKEESFSSRISLLDWDIILFKPVIAEFTRSAGEYQGKPSLDDRRSFQLKEASEHWRREIKQAIESGKTVIVFLPAFTEVFVDTGVRKHSGTGRNRATTRIVDFYDNYKCIPIDLGPTNTRGTAVKLAPKGAEAIAAYWSEFQPYSEYSVLLNIDNKYACLLTKNGDKPVGLLSRSLSSTGSLICVPDIDFEQQSFFEKKNGELIWTSTAKQFAARMLSAAVAIDASLRNTGDATPEPAWASERKYSLKTERSLRTELLDAESRLEIAQRHKEAILERLHSAGRLRGLLYEKGKALESAVIDALRLLGFQARPFKEGDSEFDVVFETAEGRLLGEAEGKDNKAINVDKLRQLSMNIHEDLQREEVTVPAKGVLFGNGFRLCPPHERGVAFTDKCIAAAKSSSTALVSTSDLFRVAQYLSDKFDENFAAACRQVLFSSAGLTSFPNIPQEESDNSDKLEDEEASRVQV